MNAHVQHRPDPAMPGPEAAAFPQVLAHRLDELRQDWTAGQRRLEALEAERQRLRETLLRIAGAIQVLEELGGAAEPATPTS